jgi:hypothetical protein
LGATRGPTRIRSGRLLGYFKGIVGPVIENLEAKKFMYCVKGLRVLSYYSDACADLSDLRV